MTTSRVTTAATSEDDSLYRQWIEEEWWHLYGEKFDAASVALGHKPVSIRQPGKAKGYAFEVDPQETQWFLFEVYKAKRASKAGIEDDDPIRFALGLPSRPSSTPLGGPSPEPTEEMFAEIEAEDSEPEFVEWDVPEDYSRARSIYVRAREFVEWAANAGYPVPPVVVEGVRAKFQRLDGHDGFGAIDRTHRDPQVDAADSTRRAVHSVFAGMEDLTADEISIAFVGDKGESGLAANNMLEISARRVTRLVPLAALDLVDRRRGTLNALAAILVAMTKKVALKRTDRLAQMITRLRKVFSEHLGIKDDPFEPYREGVGWVPRFAIVDRRGAADERAKREAERRTEPYDPERHDQAANNDEDRPFDDEVDAGGEYIRNHGRNASA